MPYSYQLLGTVVSSDLELPELIPHQGSATPEIRISEVGSVDPLKSPAFTGIRFQVAPDQLWLKVDGTAKYLVQNGSSVLIEREEGADDSDVRTFLYSTAFSALVAQRGLLGLSASVVNIDGQGVGFLGLEGSGKSTVLAALKKVGATPIADGLCPVDTGSFEAPMVLPFSPVNRLWEDVMRHLGLDPALHSRIRTGIRKYIIPSDVPADNAPLQLHHLYILSTRYRGGSFIDSTANIEKLSALLTCTAGHQFIEGMGYSRDHFRFVTSVIHTTEIRKLYCDRSHMDLADVAATVLEDVRNGW